MESLRLLDVAQGGDLVLMSGDGRRFSLAVDDELRAAVRRERPREPADETRPGPREVQARVRSGESAEEVAEQTGLDVEYVRRFEGAILAERAYVARLARAATVDRGTGGAQVSLEEATLEVLGGDGYAEQDVSWDSRKLEGSRWEVMVDYRSGRTGAFARWRFDLGTHVLEPVGAEAERISGPDRQERRLSAVRDKVFDVEQVVGGVTLAGPPRASGGTVELLDALARQRGRRPLSTPSPPTPDAAEADRTQDDDADDAAAGGQDETSAHEPRSPRRREPDLLSELEVDIPTEDGRSDPGSASTERRPARKRRSSVPSWDDIVFGTRRDEGGSA